MTRYSVGIIRTLRRAQWRTVIVEAASESEARLLALNMADADAAFWDKARTHPLPSDEPEIDSTWTEEESTS